MKPTIDKNLIKHQRPAVWLWALTVFMLASLLGSTAAKASCTARFKYTVSGNTISFKDSSSFSSSGVHYYTWLYGDGGKGIGKTASHTYTYYDSTYHVCLAILDSATGCRDTVCAYIRTGKATCTAKFTDSISGKTVYFKDFSTTSYGKHTSAWDFGDGKVAHNVTSYTHTFPYYDSTYHVCITVYDSIAKCSNKYCAYIKMGSAPITGCHAYFRYAVSGNTIYFYDSSSSPYSHTLSYDYGDGSSPSSVKYHVYGYYDSAYTVCLTITDTAAKCSDKKCYTIRTGKASCTASFTYTTSGKTVTLKNTSSTSKGYSSAWSFGDGKYSTTKNPSHTYIHDSTYYVCLRVTDSSGTCTATYCQYIKIGACKATFTYSATTSRVVTFTSTSTTTAKKPLFIWKFGDTSTDSTYTKTTSHTYGGTDTSYLVCLHLTDSNCTSDTCIRIYMPTCTAKASFTPTIGGSGVVYFVNTSTASHAYSSVWSFGDGSASKSNSPTHTYKLNGVYYVCLAITDTVNKCTSTYCTYITIKTAQCLANFNYYDLGSGKYYFRDSSTSKSGSYKVSWSFGDGTSSTAYYPTHQYTSSGYYYVCLTIHDSASGCTAAKCDSIAITGPCKPLANYSANISGCGLVTFVATQATGSGKIVKYEWVGKGASGYAPIYSTSSKAAYQYTRPGTYFYTLTITSDGGCTTVYTDSVKIPNYINIGLPRDTTVCAGSSVYIPVIVTTPFKPDPYHIKWSTDSLDYDKTGISPVITHDTVIVATVTDKYCSNYDSMRIHVLKRPSFSYTVKNRTITFTRQPATKNYAYWSFGDGTKDSSVATSFSHTYSGTDTMYTVCMHINESGYCTTDICMAVHVPAECSSNFTYSISGKKVSFKAIDSSHASGSYAWDIQDIISHGPNTSYTFSSYDTFLVCLTVTDTNAACSSTTCKKVVLTAPTHCISGDVYAGKNSAGSGVAYLITFDNSDSTVTAIDSEQLTVDTSGTHYKFCGLKDGTYYVKAALDTNSVNYSDYAPTYYEKDEKWKNANKITVNGADITGLDIKMKKAHNSGGNGFISGKVSKGAGKTGDPVPGLEVLLYDLNGNIIDYTYSDATGYYRFEYIPYGNYEIWPEVAGLTTYPGDVTVGDPNPEQQKVFNIIETSRELRVMIQTSLKGSPASTDNASIYPNPVQDDMTVKLHSSSMQQTRIVIFDMTGKVAYSMTQMLQPGDQTLHVDTRPFPSGLYMMQVQFGNDSNVLQSKFIKAQ